MIHSLFAHDVDTWHSTSHCYDSSFLVAMANSSLPCVATQIQALSGVWWLLWSLSPSPLDHNNFDFCGSGEGARLSMKAMHQNAFAMPLITRRCLRNNRLDWISHPFFSTLIHLAVAWSHWQPNACDWRVRGGGGGQKKRRKSRGERTSLRDEGRMWKSGRLKWEDIAFELGWRGS